MTTARHDVAAPETAQAPAVFRRRLLDGMAAAIRERGFHESTVADVVRHAITEVAVQATTAMLGPRT